MQELIAKLQLAGYKVNETYSGRGMFGRTCLAVHLNELSSLFVLGQHLADYRALGAPRWDNLGSGVIVYWPNVWREASEENA